MKGRSQRLPAPAYPHDDWGDGSWTVDCSCGVTFDDGEEMVNCDECGVWVHTRCSRFVKGETSFACDKCKAKKPRSSAENTTSAAAATNTEETEVAQLLVELPTKTDPCPPSASQKPAFRLWTDVPMEERVHVQGMPGGDPALFQGLSSVFTSELWKCAGYVPKKFNFQYREFPCWEEDESENPANRGADVLFSLSKEIVPYVPVETFERKPSPMGSSRKEGKGLSSSGGRLQSCVKKERNKIRVFGVHSGKRRKEESTGEKDQSAKKKAKSSSDKAVADKKKRDSTPLTDACNAESLDDAGFQVPKSDFQCLNNEGRREDISLESNINNTHSEGTDRGDKPKHILVVKTSSKVLYNEASRHKFPLEMPVKAEIVDKQDPVMTEISSWTDGSSNSLGEASVFARVSVKEEDVSTAVDGLKQLNDESNYLGGLNGGSSSVAVEPEKSKPASGDLWSASTDVLDVPTPRDSNGAISLSSMEDKIKVKSAGEDGQAVMNPELFSSGVVDGKLNAMEHLTQPQRSMEHSSKNIQVHETGRSSPSDDRKLQDDERKSEVRHQDCGKISEKMVSRSREPEQHGQESGESVGPSILQESSSEPTRDLKYVEEPTKLGGMNLSTPASGGHKLVVGLGKSSSTPLISKSSVSGSYKSPGTTASSTAVKAIHLTKQRVKVKTHTISKKDNAVNAITGEESKHDVTRQSAKNYPRVSTFSGSKSPQTSKPSHVSSLKHTLSDSKEQLPRPSSKTSENKQILSSSGNPTASSESQSASGQIKLTAPGSFQKNEKINQPICQPPSKVFNHPSPMHPPACVNASTTLSDEELALLLHQELNSSPRVPRVPRMRHAGGIPLASPTATSMLSKRSSTSGGKDQISVSRRKNKEDICRDGSRSSRELIDETRKVDRLPSSSSQNQQDSISTADGSARRDLCKSPDSLTSTKKNVQLASTTGPNGCPSSIEANGQNALPTHRSPRDISDDDARPASHTLPGLIDEIMSKGRRMTYEELCNAVLPHWQNLRKPNGERYAYSSHSQGVLDCLRNRNKWAHLIDRGPKTSSSKKRRKPDSDLPPVESENEEAKIKALREVEDKEAEKQHEDFPKGKRKARKRRRLALQGRGLKEVRKRQKQDATSDDDVGSFSHSSDEGARSVFSDDESQGAGPRAVGSGIYTSSSDESD